MYTPLKQRTGLTQAHSAGGWPLPIVVSTAKPILCADFPPGHLVIFPCAWENLHPQTGVCKELRCYG